MSPLEAPIPPAPREADSSPPPTPDSSPASPSQKSKPPSGFGLKGCLSLLGCGCIFPLVTLVILILGGLWVFNPDLSEWTTPPDLPDRPEIRNLDRWSLRDKLLSASEAAGASQAVDLTLDFNEANAALERFSPPPAMGMALQRFWLLPASQGALLFAEGSGLWMTKLVIILTIQNPPVKGGAPVIKEIQINRAALGQGFLRSLAHKVVIGYLKQSLGFAHEDFPSRKIWIQFGTSDILVEGWTLLTR